MAAEERGRFESLALWLVPLILAGLAVGGWFAWRWWAAPEPYVYTVF